MKSMMIILLLVLLVGTGVFAVPVFTDTFENKTVGNSMVTTDAPVSGLYYWVNYSSAGAATYQDDGGNKVLMADRTAGKNVHVQAFTGGPQSSIVPNTNFVISFDWKSDGQLNNGPSIQFVSGTNNVIIGRLLTYAGGYNYFIDGGWYGDVPLANQWNSIQVVMKTGIEVYPGYVRPVYDVYAEDVLIANNIIGKEAQIGSNIRLNLFVAAADGIVLYDNISIERFSVLPCGTVPFYTDTFENRTVGNKLYQYEPPTFGQHYWLNYNTDGAVTYQNDGANIVLKADRTDGKYVYSSAFSGGAGSAVDANTKFVVSFDWKSDGTLWSGPSVNIKFGTVVAAGILSYSGGYTYYIKGQWYGTAPAANIWHKVIVVISVGDDIAGNAATTYNVYADGVLIAENIPGATISTAGGNARFDMYVAGANGVVLYDNISMARIYPGQCGDECHPYMKWDLSRDCIVDLNDFAELAGKWLLSY